MDEFGHIIEYRQALHNDLVIEALNSDIEGITNEEKVSNYIKNLLLDQDITSDKIEFGDTVRIKLSDEQIQTDIDDIITLNTPEKYYKFKELYKGQLVKKVIAIPRDLKPTTFT